MHDQTISSANQVHAVSGPFEDSVLSALRIALTTITKDRAVGLTELEEVQLFDSMAQSVGEMIVELNEVRLTVDHRNGVASAPWG